MPMSEYVRRLRERIGTTVLEVPTVSILTFDDSKRVLLVRHVEGNDWTTPGGMIEPYETPSDAAVREMWEETGLYVELTRIIGVFGGELCSSTYSNGDKMAWVSTLFGARPIRGTLKPDGQESLEARYFDRSEINEVRYKPHVKLFLDAAYSPKHEAYFQQPTWQPADA
jgi:ADP-ribose pyrophosphatase YjhB (NUDIX family)